MIYAGAQKNIGPAGLTIVIVREDLIGQAGAGTPTMFDYKIHADNESMYNTPPTYGIYIAGLVFQWLKKHGGLAAMEKINIAKAKLLYDYLDSTGFYHSPGGEGRPFAHERAVHAEGCQPGRGLPQGRQGSAACCSSRATARWAACAPPSTTPCRSKACRRWSIS